MRPLLQYYEALEAQALWEGDIRMTALVALIQDTHAVMDVLRQGNEIANSPLVTDLSPASSWALGGVILTSHMVYVIAFDMDEDYEESTSHLGRSNSMTPERRADFSYDSPEHCFEAMLSRLPLFHVVLEDVVEAVQRLEIIEPLSTGPDRPESSAALLKLSTLAQDVSFILKDPSRFDNIELSEVVHAFGILPTVEVEQRCFSPTVDGRRGVSLANTGKSSVGRSASRATSSSTYVSDAASQSQRRGMSNSVAAASPNWESAEDPAAVGIAASERFGVINEELETRCRLIADEGFVRMVLATKLFRRTVDQLTATFTSTLEAAHRDEVDVGKVSASGQQLSLGENAALKGLLENEERKTRIELGAYLTESKKLSSQVMLAAERANMLREAAAFRQQTAADFEAAQRTLKQMETALFESSSALNEITKERDALKARESHVVENARRREADLHAQLEAAENRK